MTLVTCPLCGPREGRRWRRDRGFEVLRCRECGTGVTWPPPTDDQLATFYEPGYYQRDRMGAVAGAAWPARAASILERIPGEVRRVLDVGSGEGHFVAALRMRGLVAEGVEPLESGRAAARDQHALALLEDWPDPEERPYDLITLVHSLEHVRDPLATLQAATRRVRTGGFLFVDVPHAGTLEMLRPRRRREVLSLPGHLHHFTPDSLTALISKAGWSVLAVHLTNPDLLEWIFDVRARLRGRQPPRPGAVSSRASSQAAEEPPRSRPGRLATLWHALLPRLRARFPGYRFEVVARLRASR